MPKLGGDTAQCSVILLEKRNFVIAVKNTQKQLSKYFVPVQCCLICSFCSKQFVQTNLSNQKKQEIESPAESPSVISYFPKLYLYIFTNFFFQQTEAVYGRCFIKTFCIHLKVMFQKKDFNQDVFNVQMAFYRLVF